VANWWQRRGRAQEGAVERNEDLWLGERKRARSLAALHAGGARGTRSPGARLVRPPSGPLAPATQLSIKLQTALTPTPFAPTHPPSQVACDDKHKEFRERVNAMRTLIRVCVPTARVSRQGGGGGRPLPPAACCVRIGRGGARAGAHPNAHTHHPLYLPPGSAPLHSLSISITSSSFTPHQVDDFLGAKNALFAVLTQIDDLLDEVGVRLTQEGEDLGVKLAAKQAEDTDLRRKMATVARRAEEMAERQEQHVKVILDLKKAYEAEQSAHRRERDLFKAELAKLREGADRAVREAGAGAERELRALEVSHKAARDDMIKLCNEGVASLADHCLDVAVAGQRVQVDSAEMEDAVWQAFQRDINGKLADWTSRYCSGDQRKVAPPALRAPTGRPPIGKGGNNGAVQSFKTPIDKSLPSTPSTAGGQGGGPLPSGGGGAGPSTPPTVSEGDHYASE
jgi:hypothetical protein